MTTPEPNTSIIDGTRAYYETFVALAAAQTPGTPWPGWDSLTGEQAGKWMLAYAATIEVSVRTGDAALALDLEQP